MNIKGIDKGNIQRISSAGVKTEPKPNVQQNQKTTQTAKPTDKLDISPNAQKMLNVKNKIESGYYNEENVIRQTSARIFQKYFK